MSSVAACAVSACSHSSNDSGSASGARPPAGVADASSGGPASAVGGPTAVSGSAGTTSSGGTDTLASSSSGGGLGGGLGGAEGPTGGGIAINGGAESGADGAESGADGGDAVAGGGEGGATARVPTAGDACIDCGNAACGSMLQDCEQNPECAPWLSCVSGCDTEACVSACDTRSAEVARVYYRIYACLCASCATSCDIAQSCQKKCVDDGLPPPSAAAPASLAETGLYASADSAAEVAAGVSAYEAQFPLWADAAGKDRYIFIPPCSTIDTQDMDHWVFPVGTRLWKHFEVDGKRVETRLLHRYGSGSDDWLYATYGWDAAQPDDPRAALAVLHGSPSVNGTLHDIPDPSACPSCHGKLPERALGFSAFQLSHSHPGLNMQRLSDRGMLSVPARQGFAVPGTPVQRAALGYLHGNCGGCHNSSGQIPRENPMKLRLLVAQTDYATSDSVLTTIGVPTINAYTELHGKPRIDPQAPANSAIYLRMSDRNKFPMPPLASKFPDTDGGVAAIAAWIDSLTKATQ